MKKVLWVEDEARLLKIITSALGKAGYEVLTAADGEIALKILREEKPDLVLLDLILPKKDGFEFLEEMRADKDTRDIPVIVLTNLEEKFDVEKARSYGVNAYLIKVQHKPDAIVRKIGEILNT